MANEYELPYFYNVPYLSADEYIHFPDFEDCPFNTVALGGNISPGMILSGVMQGAFPWDCDTKIISWLSPQPRFVLLPQELHVPKSLQKEIKRNEKLLEQNSPLAIHFKMDTEFENVMKNCAQAKRKDQDTTWITQDLIDSYCKLNKADFAHSFEAWQNGELVGGFYGILIGRAFFGESMFTKTSNSTKIIFVKFVQNFLKEGGRLIDSQMYTDNIARYGGKNISRSAYLRLLKESLSK